MKVDNSLKGLFEQFRKAYGLKKLSVKDPVAVKAFFDWLDEEKKYQNEFYLKLLSQLNVDYKTDHTVEVGKTINDSLVVPYETKIITDRPEGFEENRILIGNLHFFGNFPSLVQEDNNFVHSYPLDFYTTFMTQNPYHIKDLNGWEKFPVNYQNIAVGVYGDVNDADKENKEKAINNFYKQIDKSYNPQIEDVIDDYNYATIVTTKRR